MNALTTTRPSYAHLGDHVGASDVCMECRNALADFTTGWQLCDPCRLARVGELLVDVMDDPNKPEVTEEQLELHRGALKVLIDDDLWTLPEYLAWTNASSRAWMDANPGSWASQLTEDLPHWAEIDVTKASHLGAYLDGCVEREIEKSRWD